MSDPRNDPALAEYVKSEEARAFQSTCPKCGALPGAWCTDYYTMHYERWGYGSLDTDPSPTPPTTH